jgi:hypothetical protein
MWTSSIDDPGGKAEKWTLEMRIRARQHAFYWYTEPPTQVQSKPVTLRVAPLGEWMVLHPASSEIVGLHPLLTFDNFLAARFPYEHSNA